MWGMTRTTVSPSSSTTSRSTPCVAGCCGPMLSNMCSPPRSGSAPGGGGAATPSGTRTTSPRAPTPGVASSNSTVRVLMPRPARGRARRGAAAPACRPAARRTPRRWTALPWSNAPPDCGEGLPHLLGPAEPAGQREVFAERMALRVGLPHEDPPQVGMAAEPDAEHVEDLALEPVGALPDGHHRIHLELAARIELHLDPQVSAAPQRAQVVHDLERPLAVPVLDGGEIHEVVVLLSRGVAQPAHHVAQALPRHVHDRVPARLHGATDRIAERRAQRLDRRVHAERNCWTEFPNGSDSSSISAGGSRNPRASSGCSSRRGTRSNSDSPLIFLCSSRMP